jgi:hypothetical protein
MSRAMHVMLLAGLMLALFGAVAAASQVTLISGAVQVVVLSPVGVLPLDQGVAIADQVLLKVQLPPAQSATTVLYLDDQPALFSNDREPRLSLDTTTLADGEHHLRVEATDLDGVRLASAGSMLLNVANAPGALREQVAAAALQPAPVFSMIYRKIIPREVVWFNGREGDLERHGFSANGQLYLTATDLFRHIGGTIIWGPTGNWIELHRGDLTVRILPGSRRIYVNGQPQDLVAPTIRKENRTFVPVVSLCQVLGLATFWNADEGRLYVSFHS